MEYTGKSRIVKTRVIAKDVWLAKYFGQTCDAIMYDGDVNPQINTEQLNPPLPKWQSCKLNNLEEV